MQSIDPRLLKWWGELLIAGASNLEVLKRLTGSGAEAEHWYDLWKSVPGVPKPPLPIKDIDEAQRIWLALFDAVPRRDYDNLKERLAAVEEECAKLRSTLNQVTAAMTGLGDLPEAMAPWLEVAQMTMKSHMKWLSELGKNWQAGETNRSANETVVRS
jgi:hypothetical protein